MEEKIKIIIIEDNDTFREGVKMLLHSLPHYEVIADSDSYHSLAKKKIFHNANVILMDLMMPEISGVEAAKNILWHYPYLPIIAITMFTDQAYLLELLGAGFKGCVFKSNIYAELDVAINTVMSGKLYYPSSIKLKK